MQVELLLPQEVYEFVRNEILNANDSAPKYSRVVMPLKALLTGDFFNEYIKKGMLQMMLGEMRC